MKKKSVKKATPAMMGTCSSGLAKALGMRLLSMSRGSVRGRMPWSPQASQQVGLIHGGSLAALADTTAAVGTIALTPKGMRPVTVELKINYFGNIRSGSVDCEALLLHHGHRSMVWEARITETGKKDLLAVSIITYLLIPQGA